MNTAARSRTVVWWAVGLLSGSVLIGVVCAGGGLLAAGSPLSARERTHIRTALLESEWADVESQYPEAIRPPVQMSATVPDQVSSRPLVSCLSERGIEAFGSDGSITYGSSNGQTPLEVAVAFYSCRAGNPTTSQVSRYLDDLESYALHNYYVDSVRPCLLAAGAHSELPRISPAAQTLSGLPAASSWNPYSEVWASDPSPAALGFLEQRCPPVPAWLNLGAG